jgi:CRP-like cAMP-binding protein
MPIAPGSLAVNRLLGALPRQAQQRILRRCETVELRYGEALAEPGEPIRHVHFPTSGFIALTASVEDSTSLEVGLIGNEGMLGISVALGVDTSPVQALVHGSGAALRMPIVAFRSELESCPALRSILARYAYVLLAQLMQIAACTCFHVLEGRLARWLLMAHDRAQADHFYLTHDLLSHMLGVRRSGVTRAAGDLQRKSLIHYSRGDIGVLDRRGLEQASCTCYAKVASHYERLLG